MIKYLHVYTCEEFRQLTRDELFSGPYPNITFLTEFEKEYEA